MEYWVCHFFIMCCGCDLDLHCYFGTVGGAGCTVNVAEFVRCSTTYREKPEYKLSFDSIKQCKGGTADNTKVLLLL